MIDYITICLFGIAGLFGTYRLLIGPGLGDRIIALDVTLMALMGGLAVDAARQGETTNLVSLIVIAIIGFTATVAGSRFIERDPSPLATQQAGNRADAQPTAEEAG